MNTNNLQRIETSHAFSARRTDRARRSLRGIIFFTALSLAGAPIQAAEETAGAATATAGNSIEGIDFAPLEGGKVQVKIKLKEPMATAPAGFAVNNPPRIALDLPDTANATGKTTIEAGEGVLRSLNVVQAGTRTRLVMNLTTPVGYDTRTEGSNVLVTLQAPQAAPVATGGTRFAEAKPSQQKHTLRDVDFRRGANGEGRVVVDLSDTATGIDIRTQGKTILVDFIDTSLPRQLERRLDVTDFGTPVQAIETTTRGSNVHMVITAKGLWEQSAYQADQRFVLDVKPIVEDLSKLVQGTAPGYKGEKLSLNFQNVEVRAILQVLADFTGLNIIASDSVTGTLTLRLKDVPWDQALDVILHAKGLSMRKSGNVIWIAPSDELATKEKLDLEARQQISELEPVRTESFQMKYQKAADVQKILGDPQQKILSKRGSVVLDARTNTLFVQDTPTKLEEIRKLIAQIDVAVKQVMIDARIVEASDTFSRSLGARLGFNGTTGFPIGGHGNQLLVGGNLNTAQTNSGQAIGTANPTLTYPRDTLNVSLPATANNLSNFGLLSLVLFQANATRFLNLELSALQADGKGKIISNPRVLTADQTEATIEQGTEIPYQQATSSGATSVQFKKATLSLKVKPQITPDDNVIMDLKVNKDSPLTATAATGNVPPIDTKQISTQVLVENGGTVVIGGIYTQTLNNATTRVPLLGDIPVLGALFRQNDKTDNKNELLIFVTPKILKDSINLR
jgi:type IV pilus assembly protein PilQ